MIFEDGTGSGYKAKVNSDNMVLTQAVSQSHQAFISYTYGKTFTVTVEDAGPVAGEYPLYLQNTSDDKLVVGWIQVSNADANVVWKIHTVTGTAAGAAELTPVNLNLTSGLTAEVNARGGAGGVTGLTSTSVIHTFFGGYVYSQTSINYDGMFILGNNDAIALEYDAGTGGKVAASITFHYHVNT